MALLIRGLRGEPVKQLQQKLGIEADGIFGGGTESALKEFQKEHNLSADGIAGPDTFFAMGLYNLILLKRGSKGDLVKKMQAALKIGADGIFGGGTEKAVRAFQQENGLTVDGLAGTETLGKLGVFTIAEIAETAQKSTEVWAKVEESTAGTLDKIKSMFT